MQNNSVALLAPLSIRCSIYTYIHNGKIFKPIGRASKNRIHTHSLQKRSMLRQPFLYKERLPLSAHCQDLQASNTGHWFGVHGNPIPELIGDNTLKKKRKEKKRHLYKWTILSGNKPHWNKVALEFQQKHIALRSKRRGHQHLTLRWVANSIIFGGRTEATIILKEKKKQQHRTPEKCTGKILILSTS